MAEISATLVKELREATNVSMMECKRALVEAGGDKDRATKLLRERGLVLAGKKASRAVNSGVIAARVFDGGRSGAIVEVNCETDFVARNESFQRFVGSLVERARTVDGELAALVAADVAAKVAEIGENIVVRRHVRYALQGAGLVAAYIHLGSKVGVMIEVGCGKDTTAATAAFQDLAKDLTLHVAACSPQYLDRAAVPAEVVAAEREIYGKQVQGKPAAILQKIVDGKMVKFYGQVCLLEQGFVKDPEQTVSQVLAARGKDAGDTLTVRRFVRFQLGEER
jgi:elongation factor Ts